VPRVNEAMLAASYKIECCRCGKSFPGSNSQLEDEGWAVEEDDWYCPECAADWREEQEDAE
jgi:hypothetical protein